MSNQRPASEAASRPTGLEPVEGSRWPHRMMGVVLLLFVVTAAWLVPGDWRDALGYEPHFIAQAIVAGEGYSFPPPNRWLFTLESPDDYGSSAWAMPVKTLFLAASEYLFGEYANLFVFAGQILAVCVTAVLLYLLALRFGGPWVGLVAVVLWLALPYTLYKVTQAISPAPFGALAVVLFALLLVRALERPTLGRGAALGLGGGFAWLTFSATLLFPFIGAVCLAACRGKSGGRPALAAGVSLVCAILVISPWMVRNQMVFDEFVPLRNGSGFLLQLGNPTLSRLADPEFREADEPPAPWSAATTSEALWRLRRDLPAAHEVYDYSQALAAHHGPEDYESFNEAQRDKVYGQHARSFILENPVHVAILSLRKAHGFYFSYFVTAGVLMVVAVAGLGLTFRRRHVWLMWALLIAFSLPYLATVPFFYRYRFPIEPIVALLAAITLAGMLEQFRRRSSDQRASESEDAPRDEDARAPEPLVHA